MILKNNYTILTIDPSYKQTGWAIITVSDVPPYNFENKHLEIIDYGVIPTSLADIGKSLMYIEKVISTVIIKHKPDYATSEQMFMGNNRLTGMRLAQVHGVLQLICAKASIQLTYFAVMTAKSAVLGGIKTKKQDGTKKTGDEMKQEVADKIIEIFGLQSFKKDYTSDVTDAISMGVTFVKLDGEPPVKAKKSKKKVPKNSAKSVIKKSKDDIL